MLQDNATEREKDDLKNELNVLKNLGRHPNVVGFIGFCHDGDKPLIILEFMALGKLQRFLRCSRGRNSYTNLHSDSESITSKDLTSYAFQVAKGMDFLSKNGIVHRDLAARNVLIGEDKLTCKVCDFGCARDVNGVDVYERKSGDQRLPIRWDI